MDVLQRQASTHLSAATLAPDDDPAAFSLFQRSSRLEGFSQNVLDVLLARRRKGLAHAGEKPRATRKARNYQVRGACCRNLHTAWAAVGEKYTIRCLFPFPKNVAYLVVIHTDRITHRCEIVETSVTAKPHCVSVLFKRRRLESVPRR